MQAAVSRVLPVFLLLGCVAAVAAAMLVTGRILNPRRPGRVKRMPYESGMDPFHDTRRRFDVRFHLVAIAFLVFDVELLFLYPWAVSLHREPAGIVAVVPPDSAVEAAAPREAAAATKSSSSSSPPAAARPAAPSPAFWGGVVFLALLTAGFVYDWQKGVFQWR